MVVDDFGYALGVVQMGGKPPSAKPWKGEGPRVFELVENDQGDTYRVAYTVRFEKAIYVLHSFQKKSPSGKRIAQNDVELIRTRLKTAQADQRGAIYAEKLKKSKWAAGMFLLISVSKMQANVRCACSSPCG